MDKQEIIRTIKKETGSYFITITALAEFMGTGRDYVRNNVVNGLECVTSGKNKLYFAPDVAQRLMEMRS